MVQQLAKIIASVEAGKKRLRNMSRKSGWRDAQTRAFNPPTPRAIIAGPIPADKARNCDCPIKLINSCRDEENPPVPAT
jgi:hypothetical protein